MGSIYKVDMHKISYEKVKLITIRNEVAKVMFLQMYVCPRGRGRYPSMPCRWYPTYLVAGLQGGCLLPGGCLLLGVACSGTGCEGDLPTSLQTATVADGTHPTGMHSRFLYVYSEISRTLCDNNIIFGVVFYSIFYFVNILMNSWFLFSWNWRLGLEEDIFVPL